MMYYILPLILIAVIAMPLLVSFVNMAKGKKTANFKKALMINLSAFAVVCLASIVLPLGGFVSADTVTGGSDLSVGVGYIAAALSTGLSCLAAGLAVAKGSAAACGAVSENPKIFARAMIFVVLGEGVAIYGMVVSIMILGKL